MIFDGELTMAIYIAKITSVCYYHLQRLKQVRWILGPEIAVRLVSAYVINRLDYCNLVLSCWYTRGINNAATTSTEFCRQTNEIVWS